MAKKTYKKGSGKTGCPSDVSDEEWAFCAPYLTLMKEEAPQRDHSLRDGRHVPGDVRVLVGNLLALLNAKAP